MLVKFAGTINTDDMKKLFVAAAVALTMLAVPRSFAQISVGGGYANYVMTQVMASDGSRASEAYNGFHITGDWMMPLFGQVSFYPGISFTIVMHKSQGNIFVPAGDAPGMYEGKMEMKHSFINIPLRVAYSLDLAPSVRVTAFAGPAISWAFDGEYTETTDKVQIWDNVLGKDVDYSWHSWPYKSQEAKGGAPAGPLLKNFDVKIGVGVAIDLFRHLRVTASYDLGLLNTVGTHYDYTKVGDVAVDPTAPSSVRSNLFQAGLAYVF